MSQTISNYGHVTPRILLTINRKSNDSIDELRIIVRGLYTHTCVARLPCFSWAFLLIQGTERRWANMCRRTVTWNSAVRLR